MFYSLLTSIVSNEKSVNNWLFVLLYKIYHFLFLLSKFTHYIWLLILTLAPDFWVWLWCLALLLDVHRVGWICKFMYFIKFGKCLVITSLNSSCLFFLSPLSGILITIIFYHLTFSNRSLTLYSFFFIFPLLLSVWTRLEIQEILEKWFSLQMGNRMCTSEMNRHICAATRKKIHSHMWSRWVFPMYLLNVQISQREYLL